MLLVRDDTARDTAERKLRACEAALDDAKRRLAANVRAVTA